MLLTNVTCRSIAVPSRRVNKVREWLEANGVTEVGEAELLALCLSLPDIPGAALRKLLRETGIHLSPMVEGVRQDTPANLARTLIALQNEYEQGDPEVRRRVRRIVVTAREHARLAAIRKPEKHTMVECMRVWLDNPPVFETWWRLRSGASDGTPGNTDTEESSTTS